MIILGINAYHGDSSAAIVIDGQLIAALEEERIRRAKHWAGFPSEAIKFCLEYAGVSIVDVDHIAISRNPSAHFHNKILFSMKNLPSFSNVKNRLANMGKVNDIKTTLAQSMPCNQKEIKARVHKIEHHHAHIASSFYSSNFEVAACLSIDGFGDFLSAMFAEGIGSSIKAFSNVMFPHSLGLFYTAVTQFIGFPKYGDEYKVMGLAPYGEPEYLDEFRKIIKSLPDGRFELDNSFFLHGTKGIEMLWENGEPAMGAVYSEKWVKKFGSPRQLREEPLEKRHNNLAASVQARAEEIIFNALLALYNKTKRKALCLSGGCAMNSVANGKIFEKTPFEDLYIHPAAGDAGGAIGVAFSVWYDILKNKRKFTMNHAYWGPSFSRNECRALIESKGLKYSELEEDILCDNVAEKMIKGCVVGWFQGRSEWGPRALGNRSIVVDPRRAEMKDVLNSRIKRREPFRPFAPSILEEATGEYFEESYPVPFMLQVYKIKPEKRAVIPAVTHIDGTGRLQTVNKEQNPLYYKLIKVFESKTGVPVILNTSFNENEPIVNTPEEALECFLRTKMDVLVLGSFLLMKAD